MDETSGDARREIDAQPSRCSAGAALIAAFALALSASMPVHANVTISPIASVITGVAGGKGQVSVIRVTSQSPQTQYVDVSVKRIVDPATDAEHEVPVSLLEGTGLVASPAKFVLAGGATRLVRVVSLGRPTVETAYRVYFRPVAAPEGVRDADAASDSDLTHDVQVSFVWGALVRVAPEKAAPGLARSEDNLSVRNTGNVRAHVRAIGRCEGEAGRECDWLDVGRSVYPGQTQPIPDALRHAPVRIQYLVDGEADAQVVDLPLAP
ncbi:hypothetical protein PAQ31011_02672 [Pandoraea aquatica]|uniref:Fimbrial protein n=1 Tax=Pandoraea aquatica TaxID=2508290 RepID=A0A5E4VHF2_9BURK|nr:fimbrial protein TcfA [Pandoraea aquatica]VVE11456.1 hypothetical protein PAQ31011_02672 [Pandoraea aquatica]